MNNLYNTDVLARTLVTCMIPVQLLEHLETGHTIEIPLGCYTLLMSCSESMV